MCATLFVLAACGNNDDPAEASVEPIQTTDTQATPLPTPISTPIPTPTVAESDMAPLTPVESEGAEGEAGTSASTEPSEEASPSSDESASSSSSGSGSDVLKLEVENDKVEEVQQLLKDLGYLDKVTGYFGTDTEAAVKKFQENNGLTADGIVGSGTMEKLQSDDAKAA